MDELLEHTAVGEAGGALSGGERQRVLLVDEATSALDTENEDAVVRSLSADPVPRTRVIVTHRIAGIRHADRVLFLEDGRIAEDGTLEELLAGQGRFAEFWRRQIDATGWRITAR
ncbi:hypothetical protein LCL61_04265 [Amycolatopsis coloradensis]|uniref:Uncharacterized protein n=1 Tax=Amycolatopsis coloradensis TaxID=76021 RepID=A0ACD5B5Z2_9PSEU